MKIVLDIETNLAHDKIWCVVTRDIDDGIVREWHEKDSELQRYLSVADKIIMHNGIFFDAPVLKKVWGITIKKSQVVDTLVLARLFDPSIEGGHSLESWGERLGYFKAPYKKIWSWMTGKPLIVEDEKGKKVDQSYLAFDEPVLPLLYSYCVQDTLVTKQLYIHLTQEMKNDFSKESITLEHEVAIIIAEQERNGFKLNEAMALQLLAELKTKLDAIQVEMAAIFPDKVTTGRVHKSSGKALKDIIEPFNPGSRKQIAERLIEKGWKAKKFTEKGSIIIDENILDEIIQGK